jgi:hypothetical protein
MHPEVLENVLEGLGVISGCCRHIGRDWYSTYDKYLKIKHQYRLKKFKILIRNETARRLPFLPTVMEDISDISVL